jgi:Bacterial archaeo-eukaryotic release factor family 3
MTGLNVTTLQTLQPDGIVKLAAAQGPCITILLPPYRPGEQNKPMAALLRTYCQEAERQLAARKIVESEAVDLLKPLMRLTEDPQFAGGSHSGCVIFRSAEIFANLDGIAPVQPGLTVGACFYLRPVLADLHVPAEFYLLRLSQKDVELLRCVGARAEPVQLPKGVPRTLDEALAFRPPDHDLENYSTAGNSAGSMRGVQFGTGLGREKAHGHVADFFKAVDRGVHELLRGGRAPLVLAGVDEDAIIYRSVSEYAHLLKESIQGSANTPLSEDEVVRRAYTIVRADSTERASAGLMEFKERMAPPRFSTEQDAILRWAVEGRVGWLYINQDAQVFGVFDGIRRAGRVNWGEEDLLNAAAVETMRQRGLVFTLPDSKMPDNAAVAAVLRH